MLPSPLLLMLLLLAAALQRARQTECACGKGCAAAAMPTSSAARNRARLAGWTVGRSRAGIATPAEHFVWRIKHIGNTAGEQPSAAGNAAASAAACAARLPPVRLSTALPAACAATGYHLLVAAALWSTAGLHERATRQTWQPDVGEARCCGAPGRLSRRCRAI